MKTLIDIKNEYGKTLRWVNNDDNRRRTYYCFLNERTGKRFYIENEETLKFIKSSNDIVFKDGPDFSYDAYVKLFEMENIKPLIPLRKAIRDAGLGVSKAAFFSGVPESTLRDLVKGKTDFGNTSVSVAYKLSNLLKISIEDLYLNYRGELEGDNFL